MALTTCPDCGGSVSTSAPSCPACGCPRGKPATLQRAGGTQTIEATGKFWKLCQLLASLGLIACVIWGMVAAQNPDPGAALALSILVGFLCLVLFLFGRIGAWWFHR
jgi:hypothetical protein